MPIDTSSESSRRDVPNAAFFFWRRHYSNGDVELITYSRVAGYHTWLLRPNSGTYVPGYPQSILEKNVKTL